MATAMSAAPYQRPAAAACRALGRRLAVSVRARSSPARPGSSAHMSSALLVARGDDVVATVRAAVAGPTALDGLGVAPCRADILRPARGPPRACKGVERLFHVAGTAEPRRAPRGRVFARQRRGHADRARGGAAGRGAAGRATPPRWRRSVRRRPGESADETTLWEAGRYRIPYLDAKHEAEMVALRLIARGLPLVIVNPAHVLGPGDPGRSLASRRSCGASCAARSPPTSTARSTSSASRTSPAATCWPTSAGVVGERYILGNRNFTLDRLFADLGRLSGVEPPAVKLPLAVALALAAAGRASARSERCPSATEIRAASLQLGVRQPQGPARAGLAAVAARGLPGGDDRLVPRARRRPAWPPSGARQPLGLRLAGGALRRAGL